ncbi:SDR family oxidoreductase, partial [Shewanella sp. Isolate7]|uniref:SDR family oxidoreductase n=1 Tax=Shewanella sp. Isolate7 TaxID=2908528 RepID=UPI001EFE1BED
DLELNTDGIEQYIKFFNIHMVVPALLIENFYRALFNKGEKGVVINITDIFSENPSSSQALYCSTKAGLESLTKSLAKKYANIMRVNSIQPGPIKFLPEHTEAEKNNVLSQTLIAVESGFYPILQAVRFIIDNNYVTGTAIKVDGGRSINSW